MAVPTKQLYTLSCPETVVAWHRRGFRPFWTWKSRRRTGRPAAPADVRTLIRSGVRDGSTASESKNRVSNVVGDLSPETVHLPRREVFPLVFAGGRPT